MKTCIAFVILLLVSLGASAQKRAPEKVKYRAKEYIDFSVQDVVGNRMSSRIEYVPVRTTRRFRSMIKLRSNFRPELAASATQLK